MKQVFLGRGAERRPVMLGPLLGEGAAGKVHSLPGLRGAAAKIYHGDVARKHEAKIDAMIASPPDLPPALHQGHQYSQISWPQAKLFDAGGKFVGFLMPEIDFRRSTSLVNLLQKSSRRVERLSEYYGYRVLVARNLASVFAELHKAGHHMIDMKPANLRFYPTVSWMAVVDTDGFSILARNGRIGAEQVSDEYIAPESWQKSPAELGVDQDLFALAVIIFQLLNNGVHPFSGAAGRGSQATDLQTRIRDGVYPYGLAPMESAEPSAASLHRMFRRGTRVMFDCAFVPGGRRPTAEEWRDHLDALIERLVPCAAKPEEHAHFGSGCGFCAHEARMSARARPRPRRQPDPAPPPASRRPQQVQRWPQTMPAVPAASARYPMPRPMPFHMPRPAPRRSPRGAWTVALGVLTIGGAVLASQDLWQPLLRGFPGGARAAEITPPRTQAPQAAMVSFDDPRDYRVLPAAGELTVPLRLGPGKEFAEVDRLDLHDSVLATGSSRGGDGEAWLWVMRDRDGAMGFVSEAAVRPRPAAGDAGEAPVEESAAERSLDARARALLTNRGDHDRARVAEIQRMWKAERRRCDELPNAAQCRKALLKARETELEGWRQTEAVIELTPASATLDAAR